MSQHRVFTEVVGSLTSLFVSLEGVEIGMSRDGQTYTATTDLEIDNILNLVFHGRGIAFAGWRIAITLDDADKPIFKHSAQLSIDNESILKQAIALPV